MTPTLLGRLQVRLFMFLFVGAPVTLFFAWYLEEDFLILYEIVGYIFAVGFALDFAYIELQKRRWDHDFPFAFQFVAGFVEFFIVMACLYSGIAFRFDLSSLPGDTQWFIFQNFLLHFLTIHVISILLLLGPLQILFVRWRFRGGEFTRF